MNHAFYGNEKMKHAISPIENQNKVHQEKTVYEKLQLYDLHKGSMELFFSENSKMEHLKALSCYFL